EFRPRGACLGNVAVGRKYVVDLVAEIEAEVGGVQDQLALAEALFDAVLETLGVLGAEVGIAENEGGLEGEQLEEGGSDEAGAVTGVQGRAGGFDAVHGSEPPGGGRARQLVVVPADARRREPAVPHGNVV